MTTATTILPYMSPKSLMALRRKAGESITIGSVINLHEGAIAMVGEPKYGLIPTFTVRSLTTTGAVDTAEIACQNPECDAHVLVHSGDLFQKRYCSECKPKMTRLAKKGILSEDDKARVEAEKAKDKAEKAAAKAEEQLKKAVEKAEAAKKAAEEKLEQLKKAAEEKAALLAKTAAEMGVEVSPNAEVQA